jgi:hypothetical protein
MLLKILFICGIIKTGKKKEVQKAYISFITKTKFALISVRHMTVHEEEDDIVGLAFVKPKSNIFASHITHLMIMSTVREIKIHAISYNAITGAFNVFQTDMSTTTTGVNMTAIVGTKFGRVYMLGSDGNVWELEYRVSNFFDNVSLFDINYIFLYVERRNMVCRKMYKEITLIWKQFLIPQR